jgi:hypothetical protein
MDPAWDDHLGHLASQDIGVITDALGWSDEPDASMSSNRHWAQGHTDEAHFDEYTYEDVNGEHDGYGRYEEDMGDEDYIEPGQGVPQANPGAFRPTITSEAEYIEELQQRSFRERAALIESGAEIDFPEDPAEQQDCVRRLIEAFKNTENIIDKGCKNGRAAQSAQRIAKGYYPDHEIEMACWEIFVSLSFALALFNVEFFDTANHRLLLTPSS